MSHALADGCSHPLPCTAILTDTGTCLFTCVQLWGAKGSDLVYFFYLLGYTSYLGAFFIPEGRSWRGDLKSPSDSVLAELPSC